MGFISTCISCMYTQCNIILTSIHVVNCLNIVLPTVGIVRFLLCIQSSSSCGQHMFTGPEETFILLLMILLLLYHHLKVKLDILCIMIIILPNLFMSGVEKAAILNEMGRMFIHSGDRHLASATFTKSNEVDLPLKDMDFRYQPSLVRFNVLHIFKCIKMCAKIYM